MNDFQVSLTFMKLLFCLKVLGTPTLRGLNCRKKYEQVPLRAIFYFSG